MLMIVKFLSELFARVPPMRYLINASLYILIVAFSLAVALCYTFNAFVKYRYFTPEFRQWVSEKELEGKILFLYLHLDRYGLRSKKGIQDIPDWVLVAEFSATGAILLKEAARAELCMSS